MERDGRFVFLPSRMLEGDSRATDTRQDHGWLLAASGLDSESDVVSRQDSWIGNEANSVRGTTDDASQAGFRTVT